MRISQNMKGLLVIITGMAVTGCTVVVRNPGPPSPAVGYSSHFDYYDDYYYYPSARVYFHIYTGYYYYLRGNRWVRSRVLPRYIRLHSSDRYRLRIKDRYPYLRDYEYRKKYRPRPTLRYNERNDIRERELNSRRYQEYRQRGNGRSDDRSRDRMQDRMQDRHENNRDPRRELLLRKKQPDQGVRPEIRRPDSREQRTRDQDRRREEKRTKNGKGREDKSKKPSDSEDNQDNQDNQRKDPRSILLR